jgi:molybdenum cofactor synthesis domain-containing protein
MSASPKRIYTAALLIIGDEILSGRTQDANLAYLAKWLNMQGIHMKECRVVADEEPAIVAAINVLRSTHNYVFTTGGIGPTHDDITVDSIALALGVPVVIHPRAEALLRDYYGEALNEKRLRMARVPQGAELIEGKASAAPGIRVQNIFIMAGVPRIMQGMLAVIEGSLEGGEPVLSRTVGARIAESVVAELLQTVEKAHDDVQVGSYPFWREGKAGANFVIRSTSAHQMNLAAEAILTGVRALGVEPHDGEL